MAIEFGIFNDEGLIEGGFTSHEPAEATIREYYSEDGISDWSLTVHEICPDHPEQRRDSCEDCNG